MLRDQRRGYRSALAAHTLWGLAPAFWKLLDHVPAAQLTAWRFVQTLLVIAVVLRLARRRTLREIVAARRSTFVHLAAVALLAVNWATFVYAVSTDRIVELSLGYFLNPLVSVVLGVVLFRERLSIGGRIAVGLATAGVSLGAVETGSVPWIALVVATAFGLYGALQKASSAEPVEGLAVEMMFAAPIAAAYLLWLGISGGYVVGGPAGIGWTVLIGVVAATPLLLFAQAARTIPLWALGLLQYVGPSLQLLLGVVIYGEQPSGNELAAFGVIWLGLAVFTVDRWPRSEPVRVRAPRTPRSRWRRVDRLHRSPRRSRSRVDGPC